MAGESAKLPDQIVMQVKRLVAFGWDAVDINPGETGLGQKIELDAGFFLRFPGSGGGERGIGGFDMTAG